MSVYKSCSFFY
uniref:UORF n=1 Tax=Trypanosoma cruzi TaxID=5693 RepID=A0A076JLF3_TRYCR|nr:uORF [Trypanosoma cruzi]AII77666.1 uORF [Trypanosoma cruzi]